MKEIAGEVWEWKHLLRNFIYIGIILFFVVKTNLFCHLVLKYVYQ